jgi:hypothetical protein
LVRSGPFLSSPFVWYTAWCFENEMYIG